MYFVKSNEYYNLIFPYTDLKYPYNNPDNMGSHWYFLHFLNSKIKKGDAMHVFYYPIFENDSIDFHFEN